MVELETIRRDSRHSYLSHVSRDGRDLLQGQGRAEPPHLHVHAGREDRPLLRPRRNGRALWRSHSDQRPVHRSRAEGDLHGKRVGHITLSPCAQAPHVLLGRFFLFQFTLSPLFNFLMISG